MTTGLCAMVTGTSLLHPTTTHKELSWIPRSVRARFTIADVIAELSTSTQITRKGHSMTAKESISKDEALQMLTLLALQLVDCWVDSECQLAKYSKGECLAQEDDRYEYKDLILSIFIQATK